MDQSYQLAGGEHARSLVVVRGGLAVFGLVVGRILLVVHPKRVGGLDKIVAKILLPERIIGVSSALNSPLWFFFQTMEANLAS
jgi:hypothetical protein